MNAPLTNLDPSGLEDEGDGDDSGDQQSISQQGGSTLTVITSDTTISADVTSQGSGGAQSQSGSDTTEETNSTPNIELNPSPTPFGPMPFLGTGGAVPRWSGPGFQSLDRSFEKASFMPNLNPCHGADPGQLNYDQTHYYPGGPSTTRDHIINRHILLLPNTSTYVSDWNAGPYDMFNNVVKEHNGWTLMFGHLVDMRGSSITLEFTVPFFKGIGYDRNGNVVRTNRLVVTSDCKIVITSYPVAP